MSARPWLGLGALLLLASSMARAQPDDPSSTPPVAVPETPAPEAAPAAEPAPPPVVNECVGDRVVVLVERGLPAALATEVHTDLAAELAHRGISVCDPGTTDYEPAAFVDVEGADTQVVIQLDDRVTHKRVARDLSLTSIPENGRALAIAIAVDELLRASWAELTLRRNASDEDDVDNVYSVIETRPVNARARTRERLRYSVAGDLSYLHTADNFDAFSLDARGALRPWGWGWFELQLGALGSLAAHSARGDALAMGLRSAVTAGACTRGRVFACGGLRAELDALRFRGANAQDAESRRRGAAVVQLAAVGQLGYTVQRNTYVFAEVGMGGVAAGAEATDGMRTVMGVTGFVFSLSIGAGYMP